MQLTPSQARTLKRQGLTVLVLLFLLGVYLLVVVPGQRAFFVHRSFAALAGMGDSIQGTLANAVRVGDNSIAKATRAVGSGTGEAKAGPAQWQHELTGALSLAPNLEMAGPVEVMPDGSGEEGLRRPAFGLKVRPQGRSADLELRFLQPNARVRLVRLRSDLGRLIQPAIDRRWFDDILLFDGSGRCLFQLEGKGLRVTELRLTGGMSIQTNLTEAAGSAHVVFAQPVPLDLRPPGWERESDTGGAAGSGVSTATDGWMVCGVIEAGRFRNQTLEVSYAVIVTFVFLALLLVFSWPLLDLLSMGGAEGAHPLRLALVAGSTLLLIGLLTIMVIDQVTSLRLRRGLDDRLGDLAGEIQGHFDEELRVVVRQLRLLTDRYLADRTRTNVPNLLAEPRLLPWEGANPDPYPFFEMAFWADDRGMQVAKWSVRDRTTPLIDVAARGYFKTPMRGIPWVLPDVAPPSAEAASGPRDPVYFGLEPIFTWTTGENLAILSTRIQQGTTNLLAAIDVRFLSLMGVVLPEGFGFGILEPDGRVLFHSDGRRNLRENFIEECNGDPRLRAAVAGRNTDVFGVKYLLHGHRVRVAPLADTPWSLVVFRDERVLGAARVRSVSMAAELFVLYALWLVVVVAGGWVVARRPIPHLAWRWLWPSAVHRDRYTTVAVALGATCAVMALLLVLLPSGAWVGALALGVPAAAVACVWGHLGRGPVEPGLRSGGGGEGETGDRRGWRGRYLLAMSLLVFLVSVPPAAAFFKIACDTELQFWVRDTQLELARSMEARRERLGASLERLQFAPEPPGPGGGPAAAGRFLRRRLDQALDQYSDFFFETRMSSGTTDHPPAESGWTWGLPRVLALFRPTYSDLDMRIRRVLSAVSPGREWHWSRQEGRERLCWHGYRGTRPTDVEALVIESSPGRWPNELRWLALAMIPLLGLCAGLVEIIAGRWLVLGLRSSPVVPRPVPRGWYLLLGVPGGGKTTLLRGDAFAGLTGDVLWFDLRLPEDRARLEPATRDELLTRHRGAVVVDHLEYDAQDPVFTGRKLALLRRLAEDDRTDVVLASGLHPLQFATPEAESPGPGPQRGWSDLLALLRVIHHPSTVGWSPGGEEETTVLRRQHFRPLWNLCSPVEQELLRQMAAGRLIRSDLPEVSGLIARGLLRQDPVLRLADERLGVLARETSRWVHAETAPTPARRGGWQAMRGPAVTALIVFAGFFFLTQPERWNQSIALVTAFLTGIGALTRLLDLSEHARAKGGAAK